MQITFQKLRERRWRRTEKGASSWRRRGFIAGIWWGGACHLPGQEVLPSCTSFVDLVHPKAPMPWVILHPLAEQPHCWVSICNPFSLKQLMPAASLSKLQPGLISDRTFQAPFNPQNPLFLVTASKGIFPHLPGAPGWAWKVQLVSLAVNPWDAGKFCTKLPHLCRGPPPTDDLGSLAEQTTGLMPPGAQKLLWPPQCRNSLGATQAG